MVARGGFGVAELGPHIATLLFPLGPGVGVVEGRDGHKLARIEAGYEPVIANPKGDLPVMDANSNNAMFFGGDDAARAAALKYAEGLELWSGRGIP